MLTPTTTPRIVAILSLLIVSVLGACLPCQFFTKSPVGWDTPFSQLDVNRDHGSNMSREVWNPTILHPGNENVWVASSMVVATWDIRGMPSQLTNPKGTLLLGYLEPGSDNEHLNFQHKLASNFDLKEGSVKFKCPKVDPRDDYIVVLYGDSGNRSQKFKIVG